jgi:hypothetical protein
MHSISRIIHNRFEISLPVNYTHFTTTWLPLLYTAGSVLAYHNSVGATGTIWLVTEKIHILPQSTFKYVVWFFQTKWIRYSHKY